MIYNQIDRQIQNIILNGVAAHHRSLFLIVGNEAKDQVVLLHHMLCKAKMNKRSSVLWCFKKELGFNSHSKKKMKQIQKRIKSGRLNVKDDDPFDLFISSTEVRCCHYSDSQAILGNTYGMCVLQDFEALTPNILARTIETVEGGGLIVFLLPFMSSLKQLMTLSMDVHLKFRTEAHQKVTGRFNERFILSLRKCHNCVVVDDKLQLLPITSQAMNIELDLSQANTEEMKSQLLKVKESILESDATFSDVVKICQTVHQAHALIKLLQVLKDKSLTSTVAMTAPRGRGKSATLGLSLSAAIALGYSNIFVTAPSPSNLKTLFDFVLNGLNVLSYQASSEYKVHHSSSPDQDRAVVRVDVNRDHRQTIQYIHPADCHKLGQAELLCIDEAAAIPLPLVKNLLGHYMVFMSSTINGYEGTGRSLSLKLIQQLREQSSTSGGSKKNPKLLASNMAPNWRVLYEIELKQAVRYADQDPVEAWLNNLLCLNANVRPWSLLDPPPASSCQLYYVNRDTLFSFHSASERFLHKIMALYVSSHYKNSPNDLQLLSDAPAHHIFVLLGPVQENQTELPEVLCVLQVCLEGGVSKSTVGQYLNRGMRASGDLIPWTIAQQFQEHSFAGLLGARVVRIATHPDYQRMGYGSVALDQLQKYYEGNFSKKSDRTRLDETIDHICDDGAQKASLLSEKIEPRKNLPPLLINLDELPVEKLHYLGVSFGLTSELFRFWKKSGYIPLYIRQTPNELTGEHSCIMIKELNLADKPISIDAFWKDFQRRFVSLLSYQFHLFKPGMALEILRNKTYKAVKATSHSKSQWSMYLTQSDIQRLKLYSTNMVDYHMIVDLMPGLARLYFTGMIDVSLSLIESSILLALGLQHKTVEDIEKDLDLPVSKILGLFKESVSKFVKHLSQIKEPYTDGTVLDVKSRQQNNNTEQATIIGVDCSSSDVKCHQERKHKLPELTDSDGIRTKKKQKFQ